MLVVSLLRSRLPQFVLRNRRREMVCSLSTVVDVPAADCFHHEPNEIAQAAIKTKQRTGEQIR